MFDPAASTSAFRWSMTMRTCRSKGRSGKGGGGSPRARAARSCAQYSSSKGGRPDT
jgi:hypothetical protein